MPIASEVPIIGVTSDIAGEKYQVGRAYGAMIVRAGGMPVMLSCEMAALPAYVALCDGFVLTGGDDPSMEQWGIATHPKATPIDPARQAFELALLEALDERRDTPALGVCLGMQLMGLHAGGELDQYLPDTLATAAAHWGRKPHTISGELGTGAVHSHHRQALTDAGTLEVVARAPDGVIEAVRDPDRHWYVGVQWHPERTETEAFGAGLFAGLIEAARREGARRAVS